MMTAYGTIDLAVKALKGGATDFVIKPWNNDKLLITIKLAYSLQRSREKVNQLEQKENNLKYVINKNENAIVGKSSVLTSVLNLVRKVAKTEVNVLITGENGTGKELIARELHKNSKRFNEVFISVDMGSLSESLFESELFGHQKGAFTDAKENRIGKFEAANGGTLFLDEIGNLSLQAQAKLLSAIQQKTIVRVGSNKPIKVDIRLICATNSDLESLVHEGLFREDLLYRINTIMVESPPLRERGNDIILLANHYLEKYMTKYKKHDLKINQAAQNKLLEYHWPGNIRELKHVTERTVIITENTVLKPEDFILNTKPAISQDVEPRTLEEMESIMISNVLKKCNGNFSAAAEQLGISRQTLYNKVKKINNDQ
nr:sigma-54 dependent transcriptional regulator [Tenacibaculum mesophilum]